MATPLPEIAPSQMMFASHGVDVNDGRSRRWRESEHDDAH